MADDTGGGGNWFSNFVNTPPNQGVMDFFPTQTHDMRAGRLLDAQTQELMARTEEEKVAAQQKKQELQIQQQLSKALAGMKGAATTPTEQANQIRAAADIYREAGLVENAAKLDKAAIDIEDKEAAMDWHRAETRAKNAERRIKNLQDLSKVMDPDLVNSENWNQVIDEFEQTHGGESPFQGQRPAYSPDLVKRLHQYGQTVTQQQKREFDDSEAEKKDLERQARIRVLEAREKELKSLIEKHQKELEEKTGKIRSTENKAPTTDEKKFAAGQIRTRFHFDDEKELADAAGYAAAEAKKRMSINKALDQTTAVGGVIKDMWDNGDFPRRKGGKLFGYVGGGNDKSDAITLPSNAKEEDMIPGKWYRNIVGKTQMWTGRGFAPDDKAAEEFKKKQKSKAGAVPTKAENEDAVEIRR